VPVVDSNVCMWPVMIHPNQYISDHTLIDTTTCTTIRGQLCTLLYMLPSCIVSNIWTLIGAVCVCVCMCVYTCVRACAHNKVCA
jgi:hypothetical protein